MKWKKERKEERNRSAEISQVIFCLKLSELPKLQQNFNFIFSWLEAQVMRYLYTPVKSAVYNWYDGLERTWTSTRSNSALKKKL